MILLQTYALSNQGQVGQVLRSHESLPLSQGEASFFLSSQCSLHPLATCQFHSCVCETLVSLQSSSAKQQVYLKMAPDDWLIPIIYPTTWPSKSTVTVMPYRHCYELTWHCCPIIFTFSQRDTERTDVAMLFLPRCNCRNLRQVCVVI